MKNRKCYFFDKQCTQRPTLRGRSGIHSCEKPFRFGICNKQFIHSGSLQHYPRIHSGHKEF